MELTVQWENVLLLIMAMAMFYIAISTRLEVYLRVLSLQGVFLFILASLSINGFNATLLLIFFETIIIKALLTPWYIMRVMQQNNIKRETEPRITNFLSFLSLLFLGLLGVLVNIGLRSIHLEAIKSNYVGVAVFIFMVGIFILLTRRKLITHIIGYVFLENGVFLLSLGMSGKLPHLITLGVALDAFGWILLVGLFARLIQSEFSSNDANKLRRLRG